MTGKSISLSWTFLLISFIFSPLFAAGQRGPRDYFPLKQGAIYKFEVDSNDPQRRYVTQSVEWQILPPRELNGTTVYPRKHVTNSGYSLFTFFGADGSGIYVAASQNPSMEQPKVWANPQYILKSPLQAGARWTGEMYVPGATMLPYTSVVESTTETVTVPAGTFKDCVKIRTQASNGNSTVSDVWFYAPGVGPIKFLRDEVTTTGTNSHLAAQLASFKP